MSSSSTPSERRSAATRVRAAALTDLDALVEIENRCFDTDRLSRRSFRHLLTRGRAATLVAVRAGAILGYVLVLFSRGTSLARIYSLAVDPDSRGQGLGRELVSAAEDAAQDQECSEMRLEVRKAPAAGEPARGESRLGTSSHASGLEQGMTNETSLFASYGSKAAPASRRRPRLRRCPFRHRRCLGSILARRNRS